MQLGIILLLVIAVGAVATYRPRYRSQLFWGAGCSIGFIGIELFAVGGFRSFGLTETDAILAVAVMAVEVLLGGALAAWAYAAAIDRWFSPIIHRDRGRLVALAVGLLVAVVLLAAKVPVPLALVIGLAVDAAALMVIGHHLVSDALVSAFGFSLWYVAADVLFGARSAGTIDRFLVGAVPLGPTFFGIPVERVFAVAASGALVGPIFAAFKQRRFPGHRVARSVSSGRLAAAAVLTVAVLASVSWFTTSFVLPPRVTGMTPAFGDAATPTTASIELRFSRPVDRDALSLSMPEDVGGSWQFDESTVSQRGYRKARYMFDTTLEPGKTYAGLVSGIRSRWGIASGDARFRFTTMPIPDVLSVSGKEAPGSQPGDLRAPVMPCEPLVASLSGVNDGSSTFTFTFSPQASVVATLADDSRSYVLHALPCLSGSTAYRLRIDRATVLRDPSSGDVVEANEPETVLETYVTTAASDGEAPTTAPDKMVLGSTVGGGGALSVVRKQKILSIALDYQDQALSCEAAALKMALAGQGVKTTERRIMAVVGYDPTPHRGRVWGDPDVAFVGNIAGRQNTTGYGVHWKPIKRAASKWRTARAFTGGSVSTLTAAIDAGDAVVIWGTIGKARSDSWRTPAGKTVRAWKGEHTRTVIGYIGTAEQPTRFVINDPTAGRLTWSTETLLENWSRFNYSGVIVE